LLRGLREELGLLPEDVKYVKFNKYGKFHIRKRYSYNKGLKNNEVMHLYIIKTKKDPMPVSNKVKSIKWMSWDKFVRLTYNPNCTKSVRMYTWNEEIRQNLEEAMLQFLKYGKINRFTVNKELVAFHTSIFYKI
jgi:isopentenyldiphosphate isomerase